MPLDLVYIVGGPPDSPGRDELRYSLRSFETNLHVEIRDVWVIGDPPDWFTGVRMPLPPQTEKFRNQAASIKAYVNYPGAADQMILANDDHFIIEPIDHVVTYRNKNPASSWAKAERADGVKLNGWHRTVMATAAWVADCTGTDPLIYEAHTPLLFDTGRLKGYVNAYPLGQPFAVGELYPVAGCGGEGVHAGNAKVKAHDNLEHKLGLPMEFISGNPDTWNGALGDYIRAMFPAPSRWER